MAAVALGARIVEKHFTMSRADGGPDAAFSMEPDELAQTVRMIRDTEAAGGEVTYGAGLAELGSVVFRKSLFVVEDVKKGELFTERNVRVIRPGHGLAPARLSLILGREAAREIERGSPLSWEMVGQSHEK